MRGFVTDKEDEDPAKSRNLSRRHMCTAPSLLPPAAIPGEIGRSLPPPLSLSRKVPRDGDGEDCGKLGVEVYLWLASVGWLQLRFFQGKEPSRLHPCAICMIKGPSLRERSRGPPSLTSAAHVRPSFQRECRGTEQKFLSDRRSRTRNEEAASKKRLETLTVSI